MSETKKKGHLSQLERRFLVTAMLNAPETTQEEREDSIDLLGTLGMMDDVMLFMVRGDLPPVLKPPKITADEFKRDPIKSQERIELFQDQLAAKNTELEADLVPFDLTDTEIDHALKMLNKHTKVEGGRMVVAARTGSRLRSVKNGTYAPPKELMAIEPPDGKSAGLASMQ